LLKEKIGQRLKLAREAAGYTQDEVQALLGYRSRGTISHYEQGKRLNPEELPRFANLYNVTLDWLYGASDNPNTTRKEKDVLVNEREQALIESFRRASSQKQIIVEGILSMEEEKKLG